MCFGAPEDLISSPPRRSSDLLKPAVYRLQVGQAPGRALVLKRHPPAVAQTDRLVVERWLPALDLADGCRLRTRDRKSTRLNSSHSQISYAGFCLKKKPRAVDQ